MLRPNPQPPCDVCLSIDVGSQNCGICLFDGNPAGQQILYLAKTQLLDEHAYVVRDPAEVKRHLDSIVHRMETLLNGRPYYCLIEMQYFDQEASRGLVFPLQ
jgi:Holliday junction resolvasome RuvABC endonuclease subunit